MRNSTKWLVRSLVAAAAAAGLALTPMLVPAAAAAGATAATGASLGATTAGTAVNQIPLYNCNMRLDYPHKSGHVPGTINLEAKTVCNLPIAQIELEIALYLEDQLAGFERYTNTGEASLKGNVAVPCITGGYQAYAYTKVVFPFGVQPPDLSEVQQGAPAAIFC